MASTVILIALLLGGNHSCTSEPRTEPVPVATRKVPPIYPDSIRWAGVQGTVIIKALVGVDGQVRSTRVVHSVPGLDASAVTAMRQWRFNPPNAGGTPKAVWVTVPFCFGPGEWSDEDEPI